MEMPKLLIADYNDDFRQILFDDLCKDYHIKTCRDGVQALELLRSFQPDLLVLDLMLPGLDGISLLHRAQEEGLTPAVLVFCAYPGDYILSALHRLGVSYCMTKPCNLQAVADRLRDFVAQMQPEPLPQASLHTVISRHLLALNFPARLDGFLYLQAGVPMYMKDPSQSMTKELYVAIGDLYDKDARQVERSIRSAIDKAWQTRDDGVWQQYFATVDGSVPRPSNSEFIAQMAHFLADQGFEAKRA